MFIGIYYFVFKTVILKFDIKTPGREDNDEGVKFFSKADYKDKKGSAKGSDVCARKASDFLDALGGAGNITDVTNCATRLRLTVADISLVQDASAFKAAGAHGLVTKGNAVQVIVGMDVENVRTEFETLLSKGGNTEKKTKIRIGTPIEGKVIPLEEMKDEGFASGAMGPGAAVIPETDTVYAPADAEIAMVFDTKHAVGFTTKDGVEILIHIGIDTVELNGEGFTAHVSAGDQVKKGDKLVTFDRKAIAEKGYDTTVAVLVTNADQYEKVLAIPGKAGLKDVCMEVQ